jgi:hypothetical protein
MKLLLPLAFLFTLNSQAQDCKLIKETDPYTKLTRYSTGFIELEGASVTIDANKQEIDVFFTIEGANKCFTDASMAAIWFEGSKAKLSQRNSGSMNCEGFFHFIFRNQASAPSFLKKIASQKIEKIVFTGNNKAETKVTLSPQQQQHLIELMACLLKDAPSLL